MALGFDVTKQMLDAKVAQAALQLRSAFEHIDTINSWLENHPVPNGTADPLTLEPFGYTSDEAYAMRVYFQTFSTLREDNAATFDVGRKMTGLE